MQSSYEHLKHQILVGRLQPGQELREVAVAEETGFGRTPVREALRRLVHEGFVEVRPRQGYRVALLTVGTVRDLFEMRLLLEPTAVELAVQRAPQSVLEELHALAHQTYVHGDIASYEQFLSDNRELHVRIAQASGNDRLARTLRTLLEEMQRLFFVSLNVYDSAHEQVHEHHDLYDALLARDAERARAIVLRQIESSRERAMQALLQGAQRPGGTDEFVLTGVSVRQQPRD